MRRRLLYAFSLASILLCLTLSALWIRSQFRQDQLFRGTATGDWRLSSIKGSVCFQTSYWIGDDPPPPIFTFTSGAYPPTYAPPARKWLARDYITDSPFLDWPAAVQSTTHFLGISWTTYRSPPSGGYTYHPFTLTIPYAWLVLPTALFAILLTRRSLHHFHARRNPTLCPNCRYDLRAQLTGGAGHKCPECGTPTPQPPTTSRAGQGTTTHGHTVG